MKERYQKKVHRLHLRGYSGKRCWFSKAEEAENQAVLKKDPAALKDYSCTAFSRLLAQLGRRVHTRYGNGYWVKKKT